MRNIIIVFLLATLLTACELFVIGNKEPKKTAIQLSQTNPLGCVFLFKTELDSNNIAAASQLLADSTGKQYLAIERYRLYDEVARLGRIMAGKEVTTITKDSLSPNTYNIKLEFNYLKILSFTTTKISNLWFITKYEQLK